MLCLKDPHVIIMNKNLIFLLFKTDLVNLYYYYYYYHQILRYFIVYIMLFLLLWLVIFLWWRRCATLLRKSVRKIKWKSFQLIKSRTILLDLIKKKSPSIVWSTLWNVFLFDALCVWWLCPLRATRHLKMCCFPECTHFTQRYVYTNVRLAM